MQRVANFELLLEQRPQCINCLADKRFIRFPLCQAILLENSEVVGEGLQMSAFSND